MDYHPALFWTVVSMIVGALQWSLTLLAVAIYQVLPMVAAGGGVSIEEEQQNENQGENGVGGGGSDDNQRRGGRRRRTGREGGDGDGFLFLSASQCRHVLSYLRCIRDNRGTVLLCCFFVVGNIRALFTNTNAFEVYVGSDIVWSVLQEKALPDGNELIARLLPYLADGGGRRVGGGGGDGGAAAAAMFDSQGLNPMEL